MHLHVLVRLEREEDGVEVDDSLSDLVHDRCDDTLVPERQELPRLGGERDPGGDECGADDGGGPSPPCSHQRGEQGERGDCRAFHDQPRLLEAQPRAGDRDGREKRCSGRPTHGAPPQTAARRARRRGRRHDAGRRPGSRARSAAGFPALRASAALRSSLCRPRPRRRRGAPRAPRTAANAAGSRVAVTTTTSPPPATAAWSLPRNRARP